MKLINLLATALLLVVVCGLVANGPVQAQTLQEVMKERGLTEKDVLAAAKTYVPTGGRDEYIVFSSGGQSGQVIVYGIPSMRILKMLSLGNPFSNNTSVTPRYAPWYTCVFFLPSQ